MERTRYHIIRNRQELDTLIESCKRTGYACIDYETNAKGLYYKDFKPTILSVSFMPGFGCSIPLDHPETKKYCGSNWNWKKELKHFGREVIENPKITKVAWNAKFDDQINQKYGIYYRGTMLDGMLAKYVLNEERPHGLKDMVRLYLPESANYESDKGFDKLPWDKKPLKRLCEYGCQDTDYTLRLMIFLEKKLIDLGFYSVFRNLFMCNSRVLTSVEKEGLYVDVEFNKKLIEEYKPKIDNAHNTIMELPVVKRFHKYYTKQRISAYLESIEKELEELDYNDPKDARKIASREQKISNVRAGVYSNKTERELVRPINLNSKKDLPELMFSKHGFKMTPLKETESGSPSTDEESLVKLRLEYKDPECDKAIFLDNLLELRGLEKMYKTYIVGWNEKLQDDSRLHGRYNITGCITGDTKLVGKESDIVIADICPKTKGTQNVEDMNLWVLSHDSTWEQITHSINKGKIDTYEVVTEHGDILKCTKDHKLLTPFGMKRVAYIFKKNLPIIMYNTKSLNIERPMVGKSSNEVICKEIPGWPGYLANSEGKIYSVKIPGSRGLLDYNNPHEIVPREGRLQGLRVGLRKGDGKRYMRNVSRLVWSAFNNTTIPAGMVIDHINCKRNDNRPENLQCITPSENVSRSYKCTRSSFQRGKGSGVSKLDTITVGKILYDFSNGVQEGDLVTKYGMSKQQVNRIVKREAWKYLYISKIKTYRYIGKEYIYDLSVNNKHSYVTRSNFINSNTDSNRFSSADPNMQQIPKTSVDPNIKKQLIAPPGYLYMAFDYSQAELRMMAHLSGDETYLKAFRDGVDPHLSIAAKKYGVPIEEASKAYDDENHPDHKLWKVRRKGAKQIAFGLIYGIGPGLLAVKLSDPKAGIIVTKEEAQKEMDEFFADHPKIKKFKAKQEKFVKKYGYYTQLFGTRRRLPQIWSGNNADVAYAIRLGLNSPCQGAAANMTNFGAILLYWKMRQGKLPMMKEACTVHDAVYMYTKPENINTWTVHSIWEILRNPSTKKYFGFQIDDVAMSMDFTIGRSMAEELPFIPGYDYNKLLEPDFDVEEYMKEYHTFKSKKVGNFTAASPEVFGKLYKKEMKAYEENFKKSRK